MAYNSRNQLKRIIDIQTITLEQQAKGLSKQAIWEIHVYPLYKISRGCFFDYLAINAKRELKVLDERERQEREQPSLFN